MRRRARARQRGSQWTTAEIGEAFRRFAAANPTPRGELQHINPFTLLVAVVLSAQATDAGVNKATPMLFSPMIDAAVTAGYWFLWVRCPACRTTNAIDLRTLDRHSDAAVTRTYLKIA